MSWLLFIHQPLKGVDVGKKFDKKNVSGENMTQWGQKINL